LLLLIGVLLTAEEMDYATDDYFIPREAGTRINCLSEIAFSNRLKVGRKLENLKLASKVGKKNLTATIIGELENPVSN
jgi:hypothetical protein